MIYKSIITMNVILFFHMTFKCVQTYRWPHFPSVFPMSHLRLYTMIDQCNMKTFVMIIF